AIIRATVHQPVLGLWFQEASLSHRTVVVDPLSSYDPGQQADDAGRCDCEEIPDGNHTRPPYSCLKPTRPATLPAAVKIPLQICRGRVGSLLGAGPVTTRAPSLRSNSES